MIETNNDDYLANTLAEYLNNAEVNTAYKHFEKAIEMFKSPFRYKTRVVYREIPRWAKQDERR